MKKAPLIIAFIALFFLNSCEEVVPLDLNTTTPKLVIEASINWSKGTTGNAQRIKLTTTTNYYQSEIPVVSGAIVSIKNSSNSIFYFDEMPETGEYICSNFIPVINETYILTISNNGQTYTATETLKPVAPITDIIQNNEGGFTGDKIEIKTYFDDPKNETNYYLYNYRYSDQVLQNYYVDEDLLFQGNAFFSISRSDKIKMGDEIIVVHSGISKSYYNYLNVLLNVAGNSSGSPFQSPPATVRGNISNITQPENYPLGYFSLSETDSRKFLIQ